MAKISSYLPASSLTEANPTLRFRQAFVFKKNTLNKPPSTFLLGPDGLAGSGKRKASVE